MKFREIVVVVCVCAAAVLAAADASAQAAGRVAGKVVDVEGNPIEGVQVTITTADLVNYEDTATSNKKGRFMVGHSNATFTYTYKLEKEGYEVLVEKVRANVGGSTQRTFVMRPAGSAQVRRIPPPCSGDRRPMSSTRVSRRRTPATSRPPPSATPRRPSSIPTLAAPFAGLAGVYYLQGKFAESAAAAEKALELDASDARALQIRYEAYRKDGDPRAEEAAAALKTAGVDSEAAGRVYNEAIDVYRAGDRAKARALLEEAVTVDPTLVPPHVFLGAICKEDGDIECARREVEAVLALEPDNALAVRLAYDMAVARGDDAVEMELAAKLAEVDPDYAVEELFKRGVEHYDAGLYDEAAGLMELVLKVRPDEPKAIFILGMAAFNKGDTGSARAYLERFILLAPDDPDAAIAKELLSYSQ